MTSFNGDPNQMNSAGAQWALIIPQMGAPPPNMQGQWPTDAAAAQAVAAAQATNQQLQGGLGQTAAGMGDAASNYSGTEQGSSSSLGDVASLLQTFVDPASQVANGIGGQLISAFSDTIGEGTTLIGTLAGALLGKSGTPDGVSAPGGETGGITGGIDPQQLGTE